MELDFRKSPETLAVLVLGTDTVIEALPARPIQLAHACGLLGFDLVIPLSWGDELVAEAVLRTLESRTPTPAVLCACPLVRQRLLYSGTDLAAALISIAPSPIAVARHLRRVLGDRLGSLSFAGRCPSARSSEYDAAYDPPSMLELLRERGIELAEQPDRFLDRLPPDRRRHVSLPGGCPAPEVLWHRCNELSLVMVEEPDMAIEIAQHLLSPEPVLLDLAPALGCHCCGVTPSIRGVSARVAVESLEPPRSTTPVVTDAIMLDLTVAIADARSEEAHAAAPGRPPMAVTPPSALPIRG